jgi:hypothetical protein
VVVLIGPPETSKDRLRRTNGSAELGEPRPDKSGHPDWLEVYRCTEPRTAVRRA